MIRAKPELTDFSVVVEDRRRAAVRTIKSNFQAYSGTRIGEEGRRANIKYFLSISQFQCSTMSASVVSLTEQKAQAYSWPSRINAGFPATFNFNILRTF